MLLGSMDGGGRWRAAALLLCCCVTMLAINMLYTQQQRSRHVELYSGNGRVTKVAGVKVPMGVATTVENGPVGMRREDARVARRVYKMHPPHAEKRRHGLGYSPYETAVHSQHGAANQKLKQAKTQTLSDDNIDAELEKVLGPDEASLVKASASDAGADQDLDRMQQQMDSMKVHKAHKRRHQQLHHNFEASYDAFEYPKKNDIGKSLVTGADNIKGSGYPVNQAASDADAPLFTTEDVAYQAPATIVPAPGSSWHVHPGLWLPQVDGEEWTYTGNKRGPYQWGTMKRAWDTCANGVNQSPINLELNIKRDEELEALRWFGPTHPYEATLVSPLYKNVLTIEGLKGFMMAGGVKMHLKSATIHTPSEHKFQVCPR
eukprot:2859325-Rhodomonas_salina.2